MTGVLAGSVVVATIMHRQAERDRSQLVSISTLEESLRLKGLAEQLQSLTHRVAAGVTAHSVRVSHINERLDPTAQEPGSILSAINELIEANAVMQSQLADAQNQIHQQSRQIEAIATEARTDALTGLANRRALNEHLHGCIQSATPDEVIALLMIDIDHFKSCNDTHGHLAGDSVLAMFAERIAQWGGSKYYAARYGGEEFAVVLRGATFDEIAAQAAALRAAVSEKVITYLDLSLTLTASAGLTQLRNGESIESAYRRADEGLYLAKKNGRNCGYSLKEGEWVRIESGKSSDDSDAVDTAHQREIANVKLGGLPFATSQVAATPTARTNLPNEDGPERTRQPQLSNEMAAIAQPPPSTVNEATADVLDLNVFLHRLEVHLAQLSLGDLPATAIMLDAVGLDRLESQLGETCWANTLTLIQQQVRGIDVICRINQHTLCIFMPGSKMDAALDRAGKMQQALADSRRDVLHNRTVPDRFCIALASVIRNESVGTFMQRLEGALDEARDARPDELIVHDGKVLQSQSV